MILNVQKDLIYSCYSEALRCVTYVCYSSALTSGWPVCGWLPWRRFILGTSMKENENR